MINFKRYERDGSYCFQYGRNQYTQVELLEYLVNGVRIGITTKEGDDVTTESLAYIINNRFRGHPKLRDAILIGFRKHFRNGMHNAE